MNESRWKAQEGPACTSSALLECLSPEDHVWSDRMVPWLKISDGLPQYNRGRFDT
jgi:hypothetical protein